MLVEVDFDHDPPMVTLRLFEVADGERRLLQTQELYNRLVQGVDDPVDNRILGDLQRWLQKGSVIKANLKVLKLRQQEYDSLARKWRELPGRLVDRKTGASLGRLAEARLVVELTCRGSKTRMAGFVRAGEKRVPYADVRGEVLRDRKQIRVAGQVYRFEPPMAWDLLDKLFGRGAPEVPSAALGQNLGVIIGRRFEILEGDVRRRTKPAEATIQIDADGEEVLLTAKCGTAPIDLTEAGGPMQFRFVGNAFEVETFESPQLATVRELLKKLNLKVGDPGRYRGRIGGKALQRLRSAVGALPGAVRVSWDPQLAALATREVCIEPSLRVQRGQGWVELQVDCRINGVRVSATELRQALERDEPMVRTRDGAWLPVDAGQLSQFEGLLVAGGLGGGSRRLSNLAAKEVLAQVDLPNLEIADSARAAVAEIANLPDVGGAPLASAIAGSLRDYQRQGTDFLYNRTAYGMGCILADDMGLGKTRQTLAFLSAVCGAEKAASLVVCPASVVSVWARETAVLLPELTVVALTGTPESRRQELAREDVDLFVATYAVVRNDLEVLRESEFAVVVLDEAQAIKNPRAQVSRAVCGLRSRRRVAVTGTPLENRILDLWSVMQFLNPGFFGDAGDVEVRFGSPRGRRLLAERLAPLMLRRTKEAVAAELPARTDELVEVPMSDQQQSAYDRCLEQVRSGAREGGPMAVFAALTRLRQICCHPALVDGDGENWSDEAILANSAKLQFLLEQVQELADEGHSVLVFSQFTRMLAIIERQLEAAGIATRKLTGATSQKRRAELVAEFQESDQPSVFLLSLKAAGTGLTLTKADYVFIFDPWWNPAAENQAIDRTHRIGQQKPVFAYRLAAADSIETRVLQLQEDKRQLFAELVDGQEGEAGPLTAGELAALLD